MLDVIYEFLYLIDIVKVFSDELNFMIGFDDE